MTVKARKTSTTTLNNMDNIVYRERPNRSRISFIIPKRNSEWQTVLKKFMLSTQGATKKTNDSHAQLPFGGWFPISRFLGLRWLRVPWLGPSYPQEVTVDAAAARALLLICANTRMTRLRRLGVIMCTSSLINNITLCAKCCNRTRTQKTSKMEIYSKWNNANLLCTRDFLVMCS